MEGWTTFSHWTSDGSGKVTLTTYAGAVFRHDSTGWHFVDPTVSALPAAPGTADAFGADQVALPVHFGSSDSRLMELHTQGGVVTVSANGLTVGKPSRDGADIVYTGVAPATDLRYTVGVGGVKEKLILHDRTAPTSFTFHYADPSHALGNVRALSGSEGVVFSNAVVPGGALELPAPSAYEQSRTYDSAAGSAHMSVLPAGDGWDVTVSVDPRWIQGRSFPIVLDPTWITTTIGGNYNDAATVDYSVQAPTQAGSCGGDCFSGPGGSLLDTGTQWVDQTETNATTWRTLLHFDVSSIPAASLVNSATVSLWDVDWVGAAEFANCPSPCATPTELHTLTAPFPMGGTTFNWVNSNTTPGYVSAINVCEGNYQSPCLNQFGAQGPVQSWVNGSTNTGFVLRMQAESPSIGGPVWYSTYYPTQSGIAVGHYPALTVQYSPPPGAPLNVTATAGNASATVNWQPPTPNGGDPITAYTVTTYNSNGTVAQGGVTTGGNATSLTINGLTNGNCYYFTVTASNDVGTGPAGSSLTICLSAPPSVTKYLDPSQNGTLFEDGEDVVYDVKVSNPQSDRTMTVNSVTDTLPAGLSAAVGTPVLEDGAACSICPAVTGNTITVNTFTLARKGQAGDNHIFQYHAIAVGSAAGSSGSGCTSVVNNASAGNAYGTSTASVPITVCDNGLGVEQWWSYVTRAIGPQGQAMVNVANGNLVLQQTDSTAVQAHGRLAYVLRRTYNSQDTGVLAIPGGLGRGWTLNVDSAGDAVGAGISPSGLYVPSVQSLLNPMAVTLIDRDGTRHLFTPKGLVGSSGTVPAFEVQSALSSTPTGVLATAAPRALRFDAGGSYNHICVDETYNSPPGVHLALWRYLEISSSASNPCASLSQASATRVLGFAAVRPDRVRYEFSWDGHMVDMIDGSGVDLRYVYSNGLPAAGSAFGDLVAVYEPTSCTAASYPFTAPVSASVIPTYCRAFRFVYTTSVSNGAVTQTRVDVTDPASRVTTYYISGTLLPTANGGNLVPAGQLTQVSNPDGSTLGYAYGGCGGTATQLCSATDPRGHVTKFGYWPPPTVGVAQVKSITDRNQSVQSTPTSTSFTYLVACTNTSSDCTVVDYGSERQRYRRFDSAGRVGVIEAGDLSNNLAHQMFQTWDGDVDARVLENPPSPLPAATTCRQDGVVDNDLCSTVRVAMNDSETGKQNGVSTPDEVTTFSYNQEGGLLAQHKTLGSATLDTTYGYQAQYFEATSATPVRCFDDKVQGHGTVQTQSHSGCASGTRNDSAALFGIADLTQVLSPRGNAATTNPDFSAFLVTYSVDDNSNIAPSQPLPANATPCGAANGNLSNSYNTGLRCNSVAPSSDPNVAHSTTSYLYDSFGQRIRMTTPLGGVYGYDYYGDGELDLSGTTQAGGWLKAVTDPTGNFVVNAYDAAGNVARSWDRNATQGRSKTDSWNVLSAPPSPSYIETLYGSGGGTAPYAKPWRYVLSQRDQLGDLSTLQVDANGNVLVTRPPRGNAGPNTSSSYDVTATFDNNDNQLTKQLPVEATQGKKWVYTYDLFNNRTATTDPNGNVTVATFDVVNRQTGARWTRGVWPAGTTQVPAACTESTSADSPIPAGRIECSTASGYDGVDNTLSSQDGNHQTTTYTYDAVHRAVQQVVPRDSSTSLYTKVNYDADGNVTDVCSPRQFSDGGTSPSAACPTGGLYTTHKDYDNAGRLIATTTYRQQTDPSTGVTTTYTDVSRTGYDVDGNPTSATDPNGNVTRTTYDLLDRKQQVTVPRSSTSAFSTVYQYDPSGDVTAVIKPGSLDTGSGSGGALVVDGAIGSNSSDGQVHGASNPFVVALGASYSSVTLQNGGWITAAPYNSSSDTGGVLSMTVSGTLGICSSCGVTMVGRGAAGGAGGPATVNGSASAGAGVGPGGAAGFNVTAGGGGGGGGHAQQGANGGSTATSGAAGAGGSAYGMTDLSDTANFGLGAHYGMGSGGGGGGSTALNSGGSGGAGGGFVHITANLIDDEGLIVTDGAAGAPGALGTVSGTGGGGGGGGSAGSVWLHAFQVNLAAAGISVQGGAGGNGSNAGGAGSPGLVRIDADVLAGGGSVVSGTSNPSVTRTYTGRVTAFSYDAAHRPLDTVAGADNADANQAGAPSADGGANIRSRVAYDADGHVITRYDPRAFKVSPPDMRYTVHIDFDADGRPTTQYVPRYDNNDTAASDLGLSGDQSAQCPVNNSSGYYPSSVGVCVTSVQYDAAGNIVRTTLPTATPSATNRYIAYSWTDDNLLATQETPSPAQASGGRVTAQSYLYDGDGKQVLASDALSHALKTVYTLDELTAQQIAQPNGSLTHQTTFQYDANGDQTSASSTVSSTVNQTTTYRYYSDGLKSDVIDGLGNDTRYVYDANGNTTAVYSPAAMAKVAPNTSGTPSRYTFTADNLALTGTVPVSADGKLVRQTTYGYDRAGRKTSEDVQTIDNHASPATVSDAGAQTYTYFADDREQAQSGRNGEVITHTYDAAGDTLSVADSTSNITLSATYYLDARTRTVDDGARTTLYSYDGNGSPVGRADRMDNTSTQYTTTFQYGDAGLPVSMSSTITPRAATTWTYDLAGHPVGENDPNGQSLTWSYNADDTMATQTLKNSSGNALGSWSYTYDGLSRITDQYFTGNGAGGATPVTGDFLYHYDGAGRLDTFTSKGNATSIGHDADGNRTTWVDPNDPQRAQITYSYNADDSLASSTTSSVIQTFGYDAAGRTATESAQKVGSGTSSVCTTYQYDGFDRTTQRLVSAPTGSACATGGRSASYTYDGLDRQRSSNDTGSLVSLHYDGVSQDVAVETSSSNVDTAYVLAAGGGRTAFAVQNGNPAPQYLTTDGQGNVAVLTNDAQSLTCTARLDPYGAPVYGSTLPSDKSNSCNTGSTTNQYFFRGARRDASSGNYQFGSRSYDPSKGAFLTPDSYRSGSSQQDLSIGRDPLTRNTYSYVNGDPVNLVDLNGHDPWGRDLVADQRAVAPYNEVPTDKSVSHVFYQNFERAITQEEATNLNNQVGLIAYQRQVAAEAAARAAAADDGCHWAPWTWGHCGVVKTALAVGAGLVTFAGCEAGSFGVGTAGCAVAGFAVGGAVNGALNCGGGQSELACTAKGGAAGLVGGAVFVATGGTGGGLAASIVAGGASAAAGDATQQYLDKGSVDIKEVAIAGLTGAATAGALRLGGNLLSSARSVITSGSRTPTLATEGSVSVASSAGGARAAFTQLRVLGPNEDLADISYEMRLNTYLSGNEHALVELPNGDVALGYGGPGGITHVPGKVLAHTHPTMAGPSEEDFAAALQQGQGMYVLHGGDITYVPGPNG